MQKKLIHKTAEIGKNVFFEKDTIIESDVKIGNNVTFYPKVTIKSGTRILDGAVIGRPPIPIGNGTRKVDTHFYPLTIGKNNTIGANAVLYTGITTGKNVTLSDSVQIREGCVFEDNVTIGRNVIVMYETTVGQRTRVIDGAILTGNMTIESDVFWGPGAVSINDKSVYLSRFGLGEHIIKGAIVRRFALIGTGAIINAGIEIGMGAIVAPGAVAVKDVAAWTKVVGIPAKYIGDISKEDRELILHNFNLKLKK